ncbi:MAG TPA: hypothetical protein VG753_01535 [Candidatus Paceibacterota bacterium]|nr:hypothetical protein [Candidatus Paceibacterota bacterium]
MAYSIVLLLHLAAAAATGAVALYIWYAFWAGEAAAYRVCALYLGSIAAFEVASGTLLAALSPQLSALGLASHIVIYVGICAMLEVLLYFKMKQASLRFPLMRSAAPVLGSLCVFGIVLAAGL